MGDRSAGVIAVIVLLIASAVLVSLAGAGVAPASARGASSSPAGVADATPGPNSATAATPPQSLVKVPVGGSPDSVLVDPTNHTAYIASQ